MNASWSGFALLGLFSLLCCALDNGSAAFAQPDTAPPAPPLAAPVIPKEAIIEPAARALLEATIARYKAMTSYSDTTTVSGLEQDLEAKTSWQKPSLARVEAKLKKGESFGLSDGTTLWAINPKHPGYYVQRGAEKNRVFDALFESDANGPGSILMLETKGIEILLRDGLYRLEMGVPDEFEGKTVQTVRAYLAFDDGRNCLMTFSIGKEDGLLYQVSQNYDGVGSIVETHRNVKVDPTLPAETWKWTPPVGLKAVEYFGNLPRPVTTTYQVGQKLPLFDGLDLQGKPVALADFTGKPVVLYFLSVRSGIYDVAALMKLQAEVGADKLAILCISMDGRKERVEEFVVKNKVTLTILFDGKAWENAVALKLGVRSLPTTLVVDKNGVLQAILRRPAETDFEEKVRAQL